MMRLRAICVLLIASTGCLIPQSSGYGHSNSGLKGPVTEILYWNDEPAVVMLIDRIAGLEVRQHARRLNGQFTADDGRVIKWLYEPHGDSNAKSKTGIVTLWQPDPNQPEKYPVPALFTFDTAKGNVICLRLSGGECMARQTAIDEKKLKAIAKEHRSGIGAQDITLESEKTWKITACSLPMTEFLQDGCGMPLANGTAMQRHALRDDAAVEINFEEYRKKESPTNRGICFYMMVQAIEAARQREAITQGEVISYLGEPDSVTETFDLGASRSWLVYTYRLRRGNVKGNRFEIRFEQGRFAKLDFYPEPTDQ